MRTPAADPDLVPTPVARRRIVAAFLCGAILMLCTTVFIDRSPRTEAVGIGASPARPAAGERPSTTEKRKCIPSDPACRNRKDGAPAPSATPITDLPAPTTGSAEELRRVVDEWAVREKIPGVLVTIGRKGQRPWNHATGVDTVTRRPMHPDRPWVITSNTKTFTAALVMLLAQEGSINLDAPLPSLEKLPRFKQNAAITPRQLMNHTSGVRNYFESPRYDSIARKTGIRPEEALATVEDQPLLFEPGTSYNYSSTGYLLLGLLVEQVAGRSYADLLAERITGPLGLARTRLGPEVQTGVVGFSTGGIESTLPELVEFLGRLADGDVVTRETLAVMRDTENAGGQGLGLFPAHGCEDNRCFAMGGGDSFIEFYPEDNLVIGVVVDWSVVDRLETGTWTGIETLLKALKAGTKGRPIPS